ncbi:MAG: translocase FtsK [Gaiellaceae bacterium]|nr:translocase FtsK [Gaiellaceae bacterium]
MAKRRKKRTLKPRVPSRVKRRRRATKERGHHHPELTGLGLAAVGLFLSTLVYLGWEGGTAGGWIVDGLWALVGDAGYLLPAALVVVGSLMLGRSRLVQVHPFRWGLASIALGVFLLLSDSGGYVGTALDEVVGTLIGRTGTLIAGGAFAIAGILLLSGASVGALVQRSHGAVRRAHTAARRRVDRRSVLDDRPLAPTTTIRLWTRSRTSPTSLASRSPRRSSTRWTSRQRPASNKTSSIRPHRRRRTMSCPSRRS